MAEFEQLKETQAREELAALMGEVSSAHEQGQGVAADEVEAEQEDKVSSEFPQQLFRSLTFARRVYDTARQGSTFQFCSTLLFSSAHL